MTTYRVIEEDRGTCTGTRHAHNGYYAGNFGTSSGSSGTGRRSAGFTTAGVVLRTAAHPSEQRRA